MKTWTTSDLAWIRENIHLTDKQMGWHLGVAASAVQSVRMEHGIKKTTGPKAKKPEPGKPYQTPEPLDEGLKKYWEEPLPEKNGMFDVDAYFASEIYQPSLHETPTDYKGYYKKRKAA